MRIGIVLAAVPGYSETFFRSKIRFLQETQGIEVILFVDQKKTNTSWTESKLISALQISQKRYIRGLHFIWLLVYVFLVHPIKTIRLLKLNHKNGFVVRRNLQSLVKSFHLMHTKLDWLHFGFGTIALGRENVAKLIGAKMALSFRGFDHYMYPLKNPHCYKTAFQSADRIHVLSNGMRNDLMKQGVDESRISVITPAIDVSKFRPQEDRHNSASSKLKLVTVARLHWIKGLEYTLEALYLIMQRGIDFHYTIIGNGEEFERLVFAVHQLGMHDRVTFTGALAHEEVINHLRTSDLYIQYSIQEGFCNAVLEAQAMGLLCIVSEAEGLSENVLHEGTGWVVPRRQPKLLANKLMEVKLLSSEKIGGIKQNAMSRINSDFNLQLQMEKFLKFYDY